MRNEDIFFKVRTFSAGPTCLCVFIVKFLSQRRRTCKCFLADTLVLMLFPTKSEQNQTAECRSQVMAGGRLCLTGQKTVKHTQVLTDKTVVCVLVTLSDSL